MYGLLYYLLFQLSLQATPLLYRPNSREGVDATYTTAYQYLVWPPTAGPDATPEAKPFAQAFHAAAGRWRDRRAPARPAWPHIVLQYRIYSMSMLIVFPRAVFLSSIFIHLVVLTSPSS
jgi:hypothetical protein